MQPSAGILLVAAGLWAGLASCAAPPRALPPPPDRALFLPPATPASPGVFATARTDLAHAPGRVWEDGKLVFGNGRNLALLLGAGAYAVAQEQWLEDQESAFFKNHTIYSGGISDGLAALGNGLTLYVGAVGWYFLAQHYESAEGYAASKTLLSAMTVTAVASTTLKLVVPDHRPNGSSFDFPSGHASQTMAVASTLDELYGHGVGIPAYTLAGMVALQRLDSGKHDSGSVVFAMVLGYVTGKTIARGHAPEILGLELGFGLDPDTGEPIVSLSRGM